MPSGASATPASSTPTATRSISSPRCRNSQLGDAGAIIRQARELPSSAIAAISPSSAGIDDVDDFFHGRGARREHLLFVVGQRDLHDLPDAPAARAKNS